MSIKRLMEIAGVAHLTKAKLLIEQEETQQDVVSPGTEENPSTVRVKDNELMNYLQYSGTKRLASDIEDEIAKDATMSYLYARNILKGPFPKGEAAMITAPLVAAQYAALIQRRFPKAEPYIATNPEAALIYAKEVIQGRWPEGERGIAKFGMTSYSYARDVIHSPFPPGEAAIAKKASMSYRYASEVLNDRFPAGEAKINKDPKIKELYTRWLRSR